MKPDAEKRESNMTSINEKIQENQSAQNFISAESVAGYLMNVRKSTSNKYTIYVYIPIAIIASIVATAIYTYASSTFYRISLIVLVLCIIGLILIRIEEHLLRNLFNHYQEVKCPKCDEYIPLYRWQCPDCETVHKNRHVFHNCSECGMKVGKLHKDIQSINCMKENCKYELYFYKPYEGGFNEQTFRGE